MISSDIYSQKLTKLLGTIKDNYLELADRIVIVFHNNNAKPQKYFQLRKKILELYREKISYVTYNPDYIVPLDYS